MSESGVSSRALKIALECPRIAPRMLLKRGLVRVAFLAGV